MPPNLKQAIEQNLASATEPFAVFDFDNTIIFNDIAEATLAYLCRNGLLKDLTLISATRNDYHQEVFRHYYNLLKESQILEAYIFCAQALSEFSIGELDVLITSVIDYETSEISGANLYGINIAKGLAVRPQVLEIMNWLQNKNVKVWVVSASPEPLVVRAMEHFKVPGKAVGLRNKVKDGKLTKTLETPMPVLEGKVNSIKVSTDSNQKPLLAVGDSKNDLPMLQYSEIKLVIDRNNELAHLARQNRWFLL